MDAQALKASYIMHITNAGSGASQLKVSGITSADRLEVVDDLTLRLHLDRPVAWGVISHALLNGGSVVLGRPKTAKQAQFSCPECGPRHHIPVPVSVPIRFRGV
jgi:hypothetical protein